MTPGRQFFEFTCCVVLAIWLSAAPAHGDDAAQPDGKNPFDQFARQLQGQDFTNPGELFDRLFGKSKEDDAKALAKVKVSIKEEQRFGNSAANAYVTQLKRQKIRVVSRGKDVKYLRSLVETIQPLMRNKDRYRKIRVYLAKSPRVDARSFPGGTLVFFDGLLAFADNEAALIGIVGHELSHLDHGHQLIHVKRMKLTEQLFSRGKKKPTSLDDFFKSSRSLMRMWAKPFRPEDEAQADRDGAAWAHHAGYDPREMAKLFLRLHERNKEKPGLVPAFFRTHPYSLDRYKSLMAHFDALRKVDRKDQLYIGKENIRLRIPRSQQDFGE